jgi:hypothetical protein
MTMMTACAYNETHHSIGSQSLYSVMLHGSFIVKLKRFQVGVQAHALPKATIEEYTCVNGANTNSSRRTIVPSGSISAIACSPQWSKMKYS